MQKFTSLYRKTLLNYSSGWSFILSMYKYPIILYINLHNINNSHLHQIKHHMSTLAGSAQVLNTNQLIYLFGENIKFKFLVTGNIVALSFYRWEDVWIFNNNFNRFSLLLSTISINGIFLNLGLHSLNYLENLFNQNNSIMVKLTMQLSTINVNIYTYLVQPMIILLGVISTILYQFAQCLEHICNLLIYKKNN